jgi:hypothetical protein
MMSRLARILVCLSVLVLAGAAFLEFGIVELGVGDANYTVTVVGRQPGNVRRAEWECFRTRDQAESLLDAISHAADLPGLMAGNFREPENISDDSFTIHPLTTSRQSAYGVGICDSFTYQHWAVLVVELSDGSRWARVVELPDPRKQKRVPFQLDGAHQLP